MTEEIQHDAQVTPAHVLAFMKEEVVPRLDKLEDTVKEAGLNGHTPYLKAFLEQYAATYVSRQAWATVRSDLKHRLRFLAPGRHWLTVLISAIIGGIGWQIASGKVPLPH
jgi:hypothetical protein